MLVQLTYLLGALLSLAACTWIFFGSSNESFKKYGIFGVSALIGLSSTTILITSLAITNDLIGNNTVSITLHCLIKLFQLIRPLLCPHRTVVLLCLAP